MQITLAPWLPHGAAGRDLRCLEAELGAAPVPALRVVPDGKEARKRHQDTFSTPTRLAQGRRVGEGGHYLMVLSVLMRIQ
jgi:hypothetical protein